MEISNKETAEVSNVGTKVTQTQVVELDDLQLALIGGGYGETIL